MSHLDDVAYVDTLQLQTASGDTAPIIFANGKHQVAIQVIVKAITKHDTPLKSVDEMSKGLFLCFADDGEKLIWKLIREGWTYTNKEGEFNGEKPGYSLNDGPTSTSVADDGTMIFKWFVSTTFAESRRISVSLKTSTKLYTTADNASGADKSSVRIETRPAIDYSDRSNIEIKLGGFETLETSLSWRSNANSHDEKKHETGKSRKRIAYIHPASQTGQTKFKAHLIYYVSVWKEENSEVDDFVGVTFTGRPCAVIGRLQGNENYQILLAYSRDNNVKVNGVAHVGTADNQYILDITLTEDLNAGDDERGIPSLLLYQFSYPFGEITEPLKWKSTVHKPIVRVIDFYGNEGTIELVFNDDSNFDGPGII